MKRYLIFSICFLIFNPFLSAELTRAQMWAISLTGIMTENNRSNRNSLNTSAMNETGRNIWLNVMSRDWGVSTREELLETLETLETGGHSASLSEIQSIIYEIHRTANEFDVIAILNKYRWDQTKINRFNYVLANWGRYYYRTIRSWDLGRGISLCRWGYNVGFITEEEAWEKIFHYAKIIQSLYNSWEEYGYDYFMGRLFWASGFREEENYFARTDTVYRKLLNSYWGWIDWNVDLDQHDAVRPPVDTKRFLEPDDKDGTLQYRTNDPALYDRWVYNYWPNPNPDPNIYECKAKKITGSDTYGYGMVFCVDDSDKNNVSFYRLFITVDGRFAVAKRTGNVWGTAPVRWRNSPFINTGYNVYNSLRVERADNEKSSVFRIFINDNLAAVFEDDNPINGRKAGLVVSVNVMEMEQFPYIPVDVRFNF